MIIKYSNIEPILNRQIIPSESISIRMHDQFSVKLG